MFNCDKCGNVLVLDYKYTSAFYADNVTTVLNEDGVLNYNALPDEVVYVCRRCGNTKLVSFSEMILLLKENVCKFLLNSRLDAAYKYVDKGVVDESHGISFCGQCYGVIDDSGYCYNDVIEQCPIRNLLNDKKHFTKCRGHRK
jgi:hypothetical protein